MFLLNRNRVIVKQFSTRLVTNSTASSRPRPKTKPSTSSAASASATTEKSKQHSIRPYEQLSENEIQKIINLDNINIVTKVQKKQPERPPLLQNFFVDKVDQEQLAYPQVIDIKDYEPLLETLRPIHTYFRELDRTPTELRFRDVSREMLADFRRMNLFGQSVHQQFGGLGYFKTETELASECEAIDAKSALILGAHRLVIEAIYDHGTPQQRDEYLPDLAKGELIGAVCLHEPTLKTAPITASRRENKEYILNGSKSFVVNSQHSNVLLVMAELCEESECYNDESSKRTTLTFLLNPNTTGITFTDESKTIGCNTVPYSTVSFFNVSVGADQMLSLSNDDRTVAQKLIQSSRLQSAVLNSIQTKKILNFLIEFVIDAECNSDKLKDLLFVRKRLAEAACDLYAVESMIYLTAGIIDGYENPKVDFECAVTKAHSQETLLRVAIIALNLLETDATIKGHPIEPEIRNAIQLQYGETSGALKTYVGFNGLQHYTNIIGHSVNHHRDSFLAKIGYGRRNVEQIRSNHYLEDFVHPSLDVIIMMLENSIVRMHMATEMILYRHGAAAGQREIDIQNLGEMAMLNYAMFASAARSSRAYCIGLRHSVYETVAATCIIGPAEKKIREMVLDLQNERDVFDDNLKSIANDLLKNAQNKDASLMPSILQSGLLTRKKTTSSAN